VSPLAGHRRRQAPERLSFESFAVEARHASPGCRVFDMSHLRVLPKSNALSGH
jgi:hypothetical protein